MAARRPALTGKPAGFVGRLNDLLVTLTGDGAAGG
jgi:hypothetical protein